MLLTFLASKDEKIIVAVLETVEAVLVDSSENMRIFEHLCGLQIVCSILKQMRSCDEITHKCIELFTVYLQREDSFPDYRVRESVDKKRLLTGILGPEFVRNLERTIG